MAPPLSANTRIWLPLSSQKVAEASWMVATSRDVMTAFKGGSDASKAAERSRIEARCCSRLWNVITEFRRACAICARTCISTRRRTTARVVDVSSAEISASDRRNLVRSVPFNTMRSASRNELVAGVVYGHEVNGAGRVAFELLAKIQDVRIHGSRRRVGIVAPHVIQQLIAREHPLGILRKILQQLEFLRRERDRFAGAGNLHFEKVHRDIAETKLLDRRSPATATQHSAHAGEKLFRTEGFYNIIVGAKFEQQHAVDFFGGARQDDDGDVLGFFADLFAD